MENEVESGSREKVAAWHARCGGHRGRLAGHALRVLNEVVELCVAAGASPREIGAVVGAEVAKAARRGEFSAAVELGKVREELADVTICCDVAAMYAGGIDPEPDRLKKIEVLEERRWVADKYGVLWRPGGPTCSRCGAGGVLSYADPETAVCPACCPGHDYEYERGQRWYFCTSCGEPASDEWVADRAAP